VALVGRLETLKAKKERILEAFFEGVIDKCERDTRLREINGETEVYERLLAEPCPPSPVLGVTDIRACLEPFLEWE
jgi:hypothetical protein